MIFHRLMTRDFNPMHPDQIMRLTIPQLKCMGSGGEKAVPVLSAEHAASLLADRARRQAEW